jgi:predicted AAA+ superfamily ATPase
MLKRKIETYLANWKEAEGRKPLVIKGIRQCGKAYIVQKFARENYESVVYMNFILEPDKKSAFTGNIDVDTIILNLSALIQGSRFIEGKTCIILDEIQECKEARTALKSFYIDGRFCHRFSFRSERLWSKQEKERGCRARFCSCRI